MKTKDEIIAILRNFKEEFGERYGIEKLGLFGSVARGEQKEDSDIDICVKLQDPDYFTRMEIKESLEERFNAKVDVVSLTAIMRSLFRNHLKYLQPIITQYFIDNKSEIWLLFLIAHSKR